MNNIEINIRPSIRNMEPYSSARKEFTGDGTVFLDANENPYGRYNRYPDPLQQRLKQAVSKIWGISSEHIFLGNGSDEAIDMAFRIFCEPRRHKALVFTPTYGMYKTAAAVNDVALIELPLTKDFQINRKTLNPLLHNEQLKLVFICSPNNPTGNAIAKEDIDFILRSFKGIVVIDEAYIDFSSSPSFISAIPEYNNLIVLQTFSKAWGLAGVRVGMAFSGKEIIDYFNKIKPPYNISTVNQLAVLRRLKKIKAYKKEISKIIQEKKKLVAALEQVKIVQKIYPSDANFLLVKINNAGGVYKQLINRNIIVRNRTSVINNCLRITIGAKKENRQLVAALKKICA